MRYIELNPLRAGIVDSPDGYPWSSYRHNTGLGRREEITFHDAYLNIGRTPEQRARAWAALVNEGIAESELAQIRRHFSRGRPLGSPAFLERFDKPAT